MNYLIRERCVIQNTNDLEELVCLENFPVFIGCTDKAREEDIFADMDWGISQSSGVIQLRRLLPLNVVYSGYHSEAVGSVWERHHELFIEFVANNLSGSVIVEMGGSNGRLAEGFSRHNRGFRWLIIEPNPDPTYNPSTKKISVHKSFIENELNAIRGANTFVHSHVLEHLYDPLQTMRLIAENQKDGDRMIFSIPNLYAYLKNKYANALNFEHTYLLTEKVTDYLVQHIGYFIVAKFNYDEHSIFYSVEKTCSKTNSSYPSGLYQEYREMYLDMIEYWRSESSRISGLINATKGEVYLFGAHIFSQLILYFGVQEKRISGVIDNSPTKIGKRLYGTGLKIFHPSKISSQNIVTVIVKVGQYQEEVERQLRGLNENVHLIS